MLWRASNVCFDLAARKNHQEPIYVFHHITAYDESHVYAAYDQNAYDRAVKETADPYKTLSLFDSFVPAAVFPTIASVHILNDDINVQSAACDQACNAHFFIFGIISFCISCKDGTEKNSYEICDATSSATLSKFPK